MSGMHREGKTSSNNINININLSMKDSMKPIGKKIENNIRIGPSTMESKRMTLLTDRIQERKREIESYHQQEDSEYLKAKMTGYTTKKQRSKTMRVLHPDQLITAFSTTNAKGKFNSRDVRDIKDTPVKARKLDDGMAKLKKNVSSDKMKTRRNSKNGSSIDNLKKTKAHPSPAKSQSKSNSRDRSYSNRKRQMSGVKKNKKLTIDPPKAATIQAKQTITSNPQSGIKHSKSKGRISNRGNDDVFVKKAPEVKKPSSQKSSIKIIVDNPISINRNSHIRKSSQGLDMKVSSNKRKSPPKNKLTKKTAAIKIQKIWKGYWTRKNFLNQIDAIIQNNQKVKRMIADNSKKFWQDVSQNSIKFIDVNIEDSFIEKGKPSLELFSGEEVMSIDGSMDETSAFDKLIKMSQRVGDGKLAKELRDMAENLLKEDLEKKKVIRENRQLKQDIIQLKEESIHHNFPVPLILPQPQFDGYGYDEEEPVIIMPVKLEVMGKDQSVEKSSEKEELSGESFDEEDGIWGQSNIKGVEPVQTIQKMEKIEKVQKTQFVEKTDKIEITQKTQKTDKIGIESKHQKHQHLQADNAIHWNSAKQQSHHHSQQQIQKRRLIEQLKSFKGESDGMMRKIKSEKQSHLTNFQVAQTKDQRQEQRKIPERKPQQKKKFLPELEKPPQQIVLDYQMNNESSDSEQFRQAIKRSELESNRRESSEPSEFLNNEREKEVRPEEKKNQLIKPPEIVNPDVRQHSEQSQGGTNSHHQINKSRSEKKGFETNLNFVKEYCIGLCEFVRSNEDVKNKFKEEVLKPINIRIHQLLKSYRSTVEKEINNEYNSFKYDYVYPYYRDSMVNDGLIKFQTFEKFNDTLSTLKRNSQDSSAEDIALEAIHLKSLLDVFNESLNHERPSGVYGEALPWAPKVRHLKNINSTFDEEDDGPCVQQYGKQNQKFDQLFGVSIARVIQWGSSLCGFIPESLDMNTDIQIDEEYINHIKETRMALMLEKTLAEDEQKMLEFTDVETEVKLEIGMKIVDDLIMEALEEMDTQDAALDHFQYLE